MYYMMHVYHRLNHPHLPHVNSEITYTKCKESFVNKYELIDFI